MRRLVHVECRPMGARHRLCGPMRGRQLCGDGSFDWWLCGGRSLVVTPRGARVTPHHRTHTTLYDTTPQNPYHTLHHTLQYTTWHTTPHTTLHYTTHYTTPHTTRHQRSHTTCPALFITTTQLGETAAAATVQTSLYTLLNSLYTLLNSLYILLNSLYTVLNSLYTVHTRQYTVHNSLYTVHNSLYT